MFGWGKKRRKNEMEESGPKKRPKKRVRDQLQKTRGHSKKRGGETFKLWARKNRSLYAQSTK